MSDSVWPHRWQPTRLPRPWDSPDKNTGVGCHFLLQCMKVKSESEVTQSCPTLSDPMDCSLLGSSIHGIFQARLLEWGAIAFSESIIYCPTNSLCSTCSSLSSHQFLTNTGPFTFHSFSFSRMSSSWNYTVFSLSSLLISLSSMHFRFLYVSIWLNRSFIFRVE